MIKPKSAKSTIGISILAAHYSSAVDRSDQLEGQWKTARINMFKSQARTLKLKYTTPVSQTEKLDKIKDISVSP